MLTSVLKIMINNLFLKKIDTTFMGNEKTVKTLIVFFLIKTFFK